LTKEEFKTIMQIQKRGGATLEQAKTIIAPMIDMTGIMEYPEAFELLDKLYKGGPEPLSQRIATYIDSVTTSDINVTILDNMLSIVTERDKANRRQIMKRMAEDNLIIKDKSGIYFKISDEAPIIDIDTVDPDAVVPIKLPFNLDYFVKIYPKNLIVIAGSTDAGKSTIAFNILKLNNDSKMEVVGFNSEMGGEELKQRIDAMGLEQRNFVVRERDSDFSRVMRANAINVIDYLEITDNFYLVGEEFKKYTAKLKKGVAVVAMQKKFNAEMAYGAEPTMNKSRLYLTVDWNKQEKVHVLKVKKAKNPRMVHPLQDRWVYIKDWEWTFRCINGVDIEIITEPEPIHELRDLVRRTGQGLRENI